MMVTFDFFSEPVELREDSISVVCIENKKIFRKTVAAFFDGCPEESNIYFSENFETLKYKGNVCFIPSYYEFDFSAAYMKKLYETLSVYANTNLCEEVQNIQSASMQFFLKIAEEYDYDLEFSDCLDIISLFKMQSLKPSLSTENLLSTLLDFLTLTKKYSLVKCFVLLNLHSFFEEEELTIFYQEIKYRKIDILVIEDIKHFDSLPIEKFYILDKDLCEIVE